MYRYYHEKIDVDQSWGLKGLTKHRNFNFILIGTVVTKLNVIYSLKSYSLKTTNQTLVISFDHLFDYGLSQSYYSYLLGFFGFII